MRAPPQVSFAFNRIESALSYILAHLQELSGLAAQAERLDALLSGEYISIDARCWLLHDFHPMAVMKFVCTCSCPATQHARAHH